MLMFMKIISWSKNESDGDSNIDLSTHRKFEISNSSSDVDKKFGVYWNRLMEVNESEGDFDTDLTTNMHSFQSLIRILIFIKIISWSQMNPMSVPTHI